LLIIAAAAVIALLAGDQLLFTPLIKAWQSRSGQIETLRKRVAEKKFLLQREQGIRRHWAEMSQHSLTNDFSAADQQVVQAIDGWAQSTGVVIASITPQWKHETDDYSTYHCRVDATGNISPLSHVLYKVEREPLALKLESVELSAHDKEGRQLSLALIISGLVLTPSQ
jgi:hypothetical protein